MIARRPWRYCDSGIGIAKVTPSHTKYNEILTSTAKQKQVLASSTKHCLPPSVANTTNYQVPLSISDH